MGLSNHRRMERKNQRLKAKIEDAEQIKAMELLLDAQWTGSHFRKGNPHEPRRGFHFTYYDREGNHIPNQQVTP